MKKRNFVVSLLAALMMMGIMCTPAFAATESQVNLDTDSITLTKMLLDAEAGSIVVNAYGNSTADVRAKMSEIQAYVDAVSTTSTTPSVKGSIIKTDAGNQVRFRIVAGNVENEFSDKEMETLAAAAGSTSVNPSATTSARSLRTTSRLRPPANCPPPVIRPPRKVPWLPVRPSAWATAMLFACWRRMRESGLSRFAAISKMAATMF